MSEMGADYYQKELDSKMPDHAELGVDVDWFLAALFGGYSRLLLIDTGVGDRTVHERQSREFADRLGLRYEEGKGTLEVLRERLEATKELVRRGAAGG
jgi:hypothetical protein